MGAAGGAREVVPLTWRIWSSFLTDSYGGLTLLGSATRGCARELLREWLEADDPDLA